MDEIRKHKERMQQELNVGRDIQMSMLPMEFPPFPDRSEFSIHALLQPAREVGGDFYDFFFVSDDEICLVLGDVSGKGVPAALFMAVTKTMIKTRAADDLSPASIVTRVNEELSADNPALINGTAPSLAPSRASLLEKTRFKLASKTPCYCLPTASPKRWTRPNNFTRKTALKNFSKYRTTLEKS